ncbi:MAG: S1-like domain-containing RNA-binding protein [Candidatus Gastranaerophilales bacterium]|nr:S1-like domain-containing RNA-binding protein [Candidatus Gastranaerophilales bacterium]
MLKLGEKQMLRVVKRVDFGVYLAAPDKEEERVLLPARQVPKDCEQGDDLEVFLYKDSEDRLIATTREPLLQLGGTAVLKVVQVGRIGAFLDWGLEKDLFLPFKQQTRQVREGEEVLVSLYIDRSARLCATMKVYDHLRTDSPYQIGERVCGRVYEYSENFGAFVAVDDIYSALIPKRELFGRAEVGETIQARVVKVHEDGKLDLSIREKAYIQMEKDAEELLSILDGYGGALPFNDKASPEVIKRETGMSKNEFKRAVGRLLKAGMIEIGENTIRKC